MNLATFYYLNAGADETPNKSNNQEKYMTEVGSEPDSETSHGAAIIFKTIIFF